MSSANRQIARAAGTVMVAFVLSNLTSLVRQVLVANAFGTAPEMEAFTAANRVSETLFTLVAGGALASSFIPTFTNLLVADKRRQAWALASTVANLALVALTLVSALAALFAPQIVRYILAPGFASKDPALANSVQAQGLNTRVIALADFDSYIQREMDRLAPILKEVGDKMQN